MFWMFSSLNRLSKLNQFSWFPLLRIGSIWGGGVAVGRGVGRGLGQLTPPFTFCVPFRLVWMRWVQLGLKNTFGTEQQFGLCLNVKCLLSFLKLNLLNFPPYPGAHVSYSCKRIIGTLYRNEQKVNTGAPLVMMGRFVVFRSTMMIAIR